MRKGIVERCVAASRKILRDLRIMKKVREQMLMTAECHNMEESFFG